jgi:tRNA (mo5U34)-methyltransferase
MTQSVDQQSQDHGAALKSGSNGLGRFMSAVRRWQSHSSPSARSISESSGARPDIPNTPEARALMDRVGQIEWYHAIELPHGIVTPGRADHRDQVSRYGLPEDMTGLRALDVATFDGFWAFEMERRGADVLATDIGRWSEADIPARWVERMSPEQDAVTGAGFRLARELLGSSVERKTISVYDLDPEEIGMFDVVMMSDLLLHIRDPQEALERLYEVTTPGGYAIVAEPYDSKLDRVTNALVVQLSGFEQRIWSIPSSAALKFMVGLAGFDPVEEVSRFRLNYDHPFATTDGTARPEPAEGNNS